MNNLLLNAELHRNIMLQVLKDIYSDTTIAHCLGFKGGTAAYIFYALDRFSTDLDFDITDSNKTDLVFAKVKAIVENHGQLKEARHKKFSLFFLLSYTEKSHNIKVEINLRTFGSRYEVKTYLGISMLVMIREDMFAHELVAMHERLGKTNRDIYDVWFFLKNNWSINKEIVIQRTNLPFAKFLKQCVKNLQKMSNRNILNGIGELLDAKQKKWAKDRLISDTVFLLQVTLENEGR